VNLCHCVSTDAEGRPRESQHDFISLRHDYRFASLPPTFTGMSSPHLKAVIFDVCPSCMYMIIKNYTLNLAPFI
jgi:hypothetical protein